MLFLFCLKEVVNRCHQILLAPLDKSPRPKQGGVMGTELPPWSHSFPSRGSSQPAFPSLSREFTCSSPRVKSKAPCSHYLSSYPLHKKLEEGISTSASSNSHPSSAFVFTSPNRCAVSSATAFTLPVAMLLAFLIF